METEKQFSSNSQKSKSFKNVIIILIGVVILTGVIGIFYWQKKETKPSSHLTPTPQTSSSPTKIPATPSITVLYPNGGEIWALGQSYKVRWKSVGVDKVNILLVDHRAPEIRGSMAYYKGCYLNHSPIDAKKGEFVIDNLFMIRYKREPDWWGENNIIPGNKYVIRVENANDRSLYDSSDSYFSIIESANWQTYKNNKYGFEVKYPIGYKITSETSNRTDFIDRTGNFKFWIRVVKGINNFWWSKDGDYYYFDNKNKVRNKYHGDRILTPWDYTETGEEIYLFSAGDVGTMLHEYAFTNFQKDFVVLIGTAFDYNELEINNLVDEFNNFVEEFHQILSTFKFVK